MRLSSDEKAKDGRHFSPDQHARSYYRRRRWCGRHLLHSRSRRRRWLGLVFKLTAALVFSLVVFTPILAPSYLHPPAHYTQLAQRCSGPDKADKADKANNADDGCANPRHENVFISASLYDRDGHLADGPWGQALVELVHLLGPDHVFVSIYENDSGPAGEAALDRLRSRLLRQHLPPSRMSLVYDDDDADVPLSAFPNVTMPDGSVRTKRLAYLSEMRNRALRRLDTLGGVVDSMVFARVLFLNDVAFRPMDAAQLLFSTNVDGNSDGRAQYLAACALDFKHPHLLYDVYAQRDADGFSNGVPLFPYFSGAGTGTSRSAMLAQLDAVPVQSCWGGMVAVDAHYLQHRGMTLPRADFQEVGSHVVDPAQPHRIAAPVRFRHEPELFVDACECCLFLADLGEVAGIAGEGIYVNPYVRVAYDGPTLRWVRVVQRWERLLAVPQAVATVLARLPTHNPHRRVRDGDAFVEEVWSAAAQAWQLTARTGRSGLFCGVREMQLLREEPRQGDVNWENVAIPPGQSLFFPT